MHVIDLNVINLHCLFLSIQQVLDRTKFLYISYIFLCSLFAPIFSSFSELILLFDHLTGIHIVAYYALWVVMGWCSSHRAGF